MLKGARRGMPLSADGLDEILGGARARAGLAHATCHQLRHTCLTQLRKAGMSVPARAGTGRGAPRQAAAAGPRCSPTATQVGGAHPGSRPAPNAQYGHVGNSVS